MVQVICTNLGISPQAIAKEDIEGIWDIILDFIKFLLPHLAFQGLLQFENLSKYVFEGGMNFQS